MSIYVAKHGETLESMTDSLAGPDATLTALGEDQALQTAEDLMGKLVLNHALHIICSPRQRTVRTATIIAEFFGLSPFVINQDERLQERDLRQFVGQVRRTVLALPEEKLVKGGAESLQSFEARTKLMYEDALRHDRSAQAATVLVTHNGNVAALCKAAGKALPEAFAPTRVLLLSD